MSAASRRAFTLRRRARRDPALVELELILEGGDFALARDGRLEPGLWIERDDAPRAARLGAPTPRDGPSPDLRPEARGAAWRSIEGHAVCWIPCRTDDAVAALRARLDAAGVRRHEGDIPPATRYVVERGLRASLEILGEPDRTTPGGVPVFVDPPLAASDWTPSLSVLSLDIETDPRRDRLLSIAYHGCGAAETLLLTPRGLDCPANAVACRDERELLRRFATRVRELDPDVLTGWSVIGFDLAQLVRFARRRGVRLELGRLPGETLVERDGGRRGAGRASVPGRVVLDGLDLVRDAHLHLDSYSLESVSRHVLGRGKLFAGADRLEEILRTFRDDRARFAEYNLRDARLVNEILDALQLVELTVERSVLTGMPLDRVGSSIAAFELLYTQALHRRSIVAPSMPPGGGAAIAAGGGHVLEPTPGLHERVLALDFRSLYPSVIRTFGIDPLGLLPAGHTERDPLVAPNGVEFRRGAGLLPALLDELMPRREAAIERHDPVAGHALKILMNSFYGVLGTSACRFADARLADSITSFGRTILLWAKARIEREGLEVLYGDTDSLFVRSGRPDAASALALGRALTDRINRALAAHVRETWEVESRLELRLERVYQRLVLHATRAGAGGARKRYAGLVDDGGERRVVFVGMEVVRRDWTALARRVQRELYERLFDDRPVEPFLRETVARLRSGAFDDELVYRKTLGKPLDAYTGPVPPHVVAARAMRRPPRRTVRYVITTVGPEPATERSGAPLDHEHYVERQIRPVAEPVLSLVGLRFERVTGDDRQLPLF